MLERHSGKPNKIWIAGVDTQYLRAYSVSIIFFRIFQFIFSRVTVHKLLFWNCEPFISRILNHFFSFLEYAWREQRLCRRGRGERIEAGITSGHSSLVRVWNFESCCEFRALQAPDCGILADVLSRWLWNRRMLDTDKTRLPGQQAVAESD